MAHYVVDPERSSASAVARPALGNDPGPEVASIAGRVDVDDERAAGSITITLDGHPSHPVVIDLAGTNAELTTGGDADDALVLHGRTDRPAGAFGLTGPPLLNPTVLLRWRLVLVPDRP